MTKMETNIPKLSIVVPVFQAEKYLKKCIDSILYQAFSDFELLLINDGCTDKSGQICDEYAAKDKRIRVFHQENSGVSSARNLGIDRAIGEWICFVDSDDWIENEAFHEIINCLDNKNVDLVIWGIRVVNNNYSNELSLPLGGFFKGKEEVDELLVLSDLHGLLESPCNKLYRNKLIKENKLAFDSDLSYLEDIRFNCYYIKHISSVFSICKSYYNYRKEYNRISLTSQLPKNLAGVIEENIRLRRKIFSSYSGIYSKKYDFFLEKMRENVHLTLILAMYGNKEIVSKKRKEAWRKLLYSVNIEVFKGKYIYYLLKTNSPFLLNRFCSIHYTIRKKFPSLLIFYHKIRSKSTNLGSLDNF